MKIREAKMRVLLILLALASSAAWAEWRHVPAADTKYSRVYIDPATLERTGSVVTLHELRNYSKTWIYGERSSTARSEYDCTGERHRIRQLVLYVGEQSAGGVIHTLEFDEVEWEPVALGSVERAVLDEVCRE
jgi:hypothetical protein